MGLTYFTDMHKKEYLKKYANLQVTIPETVQPTEQEKLKTLRTDFDQRQKKLRELNLFKQRIESAQENQRNLKTKNQF